MDELKYLTFVGQSQPWDIYLGGGDGGDEERNNDHVDEEKSKSHLLRRCPPGFPRSESITWRSLILLITAEASEGSGKVL